MLGEHELGGWLVPLNLANGILDDGCFGARASGWDTVLAKRNLVEGSAPSVWIDVDVNVGHAHCEFGTQVGRLATRWFC